MREDTEQTQNEWSEDTGSLGRMRTYEAGDGGPDIRDVRGWQVFGTGGAHIGEVSDLLVDGAATETRYLQVRLDPLLADGSTAGVTSFREHMVRETLTDLENRMTADHHLEGYHAGTGERHVLLPIGRASFDHASVHVDDLTTEDALRLPSYAPGTLDLEPAGGQ
jgi:hypothetical protein